MYAPDILNWLWRNYIQHWSILCLTSNNNACFTSKSTCSLLMNNWCWHVDYAESGDEEQASDAEDNQACLSLPQLPTDLWAPQTSYEKYKARVSKELESSEDTGGEEKPNWRNSCAHSNNPVLNCLL